MSKNRACWADRCSSLEIREERYLSMSPDGAVGTVSHRKLSCSAAYLAMRNVGTVHVVSKGSPRDANDMALKTEWIGGHSQSVHFGGMLSLHLANHRVPLKL